MDKYDQTHRIISNMAGVKMRMNSHKGAIESAEPKVLLQKMLNEVDELGEAIDEENIMHIIEEAADVFNFLVGITHQQITKYQERKK